MKKLILTFTALLAAGITSASAAGQSGWTYSPVTGHWYNLILRADYWSDWIDGAPEFYPYGNPGYLARIGDQPGELAEMLRLFKSPAIRSGVGGFYCANGTRSYLSLAPAYYTATSVSIRTMGANYGLCAIAELDVYPFAPHAP